MKNVPKINAKIFKIPATEIAEKDFGQKLYANMVMLGALISIRDIVSEEFLEKAIRDTVSKRTVTINLKAYKKGKEFRSRFI